jgi:hypothetical protein
METITIGRLVRHACASCDASVPQDAGGVVTARSLSAECLLLAAVLREERRMRSDDLAIEGHPPCGAPRDARCLAPGRCGSHQLVPA